MKYWALIMNCAKKMKERSMRKSKWDKWLGIKSKNSLRCKLSINNNNKKNNQWKKYKIKDNVSLWKKYVRKKDCWLFVCLTAEILRN